MNWSPPHADMCSLPHVSWLSVMMRHALSISASPDPTYYIAHINTFLLQHCNYSVLHLFLAVSLSLQCLPTCLLLYLQYNMTLTICSQCPSHSLLFYLSWNYSE